MVEPTARGDPVSPLRWTCKSTRKLAQELNRQGQRVSHTKVAQLLTELGYSLQGTRNAQFEYMNEQVKALQLHRGTSPALVGVLWRGQPVVWVDAKKIYPWRAKELLGEFSNKGREYRPKGPSGSGAGL